MPAVSPSLSWDDFRLIKAVADTRTLPAAAIVLRVDHSTVFRRLRQIETMLGVKLFERHREGYALTTAGEQAVTLATRMDEEITELTRRIAGQELSPAGELRVTTNDSLLVDLLTPIFAGFQAECHDVRLDVVLTNHALNLSKRDADVAIRATDQPPETLVGKRAASIAWALYGRSGQFPKPKSLSIEKLLAERWVAPGDHLHSLKSARYAEQHLAPERIAYRVNTMVGLAEAISHGLGIGHLPCFMGDRRTDLVRLSQPLPELATDLWLLTHEDLRNTPRVRVFLDYVSSELAKARKRIEGHTPATSRSSRPEII